MAREHDVHVISGELDVGQRSPDLDSLDITYEGVTWTATPLPANRLSLLWRLATRDSGVVFWRHGDRIRALSRAVERYQEANRTDLIQVVMGDSAPVLAAARGPRVLLLFDAFSRHVERELSNAIRLRDRARWRMELRKIRAWETRWYPLAHRIACNSSVDAEALSVLLTKPVDVVPNPIALAFFDEPSLAKRSDVVTLVATLSYRPNVDAVLWFTGEVWPHVLRRGPTARLTIVGRNPVREVCDAAERVGASLHPNVDDVRPFYWEAAVAVAPIRLGTGVRNKILHAMACRTPVVATPTALEGLPVDHRLLTIESDARAFGEAVLDVLEDPAPARAKSEEARRFVESLRLDVVADSLSDWWKTAIHEAR